MSENKITFGRFPLDKCTEELDRSRRALEECWQLLEEMFSNTDISPYINTNGYNKSINDLVIAHLLTKGHEDFLEKGRNNNYYLGEVADVALYTLFDNKKQLKNLNDMNGVKLVYNQNNNTYYLTKHKKK